MSAHLIVVDLGFGDAGKGATVDWLCSAEAGLGVAGVVRFNGGAQAAHNVVVDGRHHCFAQFGAGTFSRVPTLLSRYCLVEPMALASESERLAALGVVDPLGLVAIDGDALLTTPIHIAANRAREDARGSSRHGSCGRGIGETASYALEYDAPRVRDCRDPVLLRAKLDQLAAHYAPLLTGSAHGFEPIDDLVRMYREFTCAVRIVDGAAELARMVARGRVVFEGAQGVLLDEWRGFHPHTTWSTVEPRNAHALLAEVGASGQVLGVTRAYATRHGAGPLPTEAPLEIPEPHNGFGHYQGDFRQGHFDLVLARYAVAACGRVDALVVNHLDAVVPDLRANRVSRNSGAADHRPGSNSVAAGSVRSAAGTENATPAAATCSNSAAAGTVPIAAGTDDPTPAAGTWRAAVAYSTQESGRITELPLGTWQDLAHQQHLTDLITTAQPELHDIDGDMGAWISTSLDIPLALTAHGPTRADRRAHAALGTAPNAESHTRSGALASPGAKSRRPTRVQVAAMADANHPIGFGDHGPARADSRTHAAVSADQSARGSTPNGRRSNRAEVKLAASPNIDHPTRVRQDVARGAIGGVH
ncbi:hypothetical protein GCM10011591_09430 [Nocardia camponoti]|uniref:Adenylosuccinate synthetase n=1 Tax=Nocardia camponoti TaxID=1616106 RepID=A0A917V5C0_9NOCA|nr:adenylosuccinate synthetase [Nocardia camponoti]GGK39925.1 hypothetical protein GCM10011591_09430 [Nocardia camponoti]